MNLFNIETNTENLQLKLSSHSPEMRNIDPSYSCKSTWKYPGWSISAIVRMWLGNFWASLRSFWEGHKGKSTFIIMLRDSCIFTDSLTDAAEWSWQELTQYMVVSPLWQLRECVFSGLKFFSFLISNVINIDKYNPYKQKH